MMAAVMMGFIVVSFSMSGGAEQTDTRLKTLAVIYTQIQFAHVQKCSLAFPPLHH